MGRERGAESWLSPTRLCFLFFSKFDAFCCTHGERKKRTRETKRKGKERDREGDKRETEKKKEQKVETQRVRDEEKKKKTEQERKSKTKKESMRKNKLSVPFSKFLSFVFYCLFVSFSFLFPSFTFSLFNSFSLSLSLLSIYKINICEGKIKRARSS